MARSWMSFDSSIHYWLRVAWLIALVMTEAAKSNKVENNVLIELMPVSKRNLDDPIRGFRIVAIDVKYRRMSDLRSVRRIDRTAAKLRRGRESDLVIDNNVDRSAGPVSGEVRQLKRFHH